MVVLIYGSQTWAPMKKEFSNLRICQRKMERKLLYITRKDRLKNEDIRRTTNIKGVAATTTHANWSRVSRVVRLNQMKWAHSMIVRTYDR